MVSDLAMQAYRKQIFLNFFLGLSGHCQQALAKASSRTPPMRRYLSPPPNENMKLCLWEIGTVIPIKSMITLIYMLLGIVFDHSDYLL
jgi:hypothetical protein